MEDRLRMQVQDYPTSSSLSRTFKILKNLSPSSRRDITFAVFAATWLIGLSAWVVLPWPRPTSGHLASSKPIPNASGLGVEGSGKGLAVVLLVKQKSCWVVATVIVVFDLVWWVSPNALGFTIQFHVVLIAPSNSWAAEKIPTLSNSIILFHWHWNLDC